jgi:hypothetical protein
VRSFLFCQSSRLRLREPPFSDFRSFALAPPLSRPRRCRGPSPHDKLSEDGEHNVVPLRVLPAPVPIRSTVHQSGATHAYWLSLRGCLHPSVAPRTEPPVLQATVFRQQPHAGPMTLSCPRLPCGREGRAAPPGGHEAGSFRRGCSPHAGTKAVASAAPKLRVRASFSRSWRVHPWVCSAQAKNASRTWSRFVRGSAASK